MGPHQIEEETVESDVMHNVTRWEARFCQLAHHAYKVFRRPGAQHAGLDGDGDQVTAPRADGEGAFHAEPGSPHEGTERCTRAYADPAPAELTHQVHQPIVELEVRCL